MPKTYMQDPSGSIFTTTVPEYHKESVKLSATVGKRGIAAQSKAKLLTLLAEHPTIYTIIRSVSSTGLTRTMDFYIVQGDSLRCITALFVDVLGWGESPTRALKVSGAGMDMAWHSCYTVYSIIGLDVNKVNNSIL